MQASIPQQQAQLHENQPKPVVSKQNQSKKSQKQIQKKNAKEKKQFVHKRQKSVKQVKQVKSTLDKQTQIALLVSSIVDKNIQDYKHNILLLNTTLNCLLSLRTALQKALKTHSCFSILRMIIMVFKYQPTKTVERENILFVIYSELTRFYHTQYQESKEIDQILISNFYKISYHLIPQYLKLWRENAIRDNQQIIQNLANHLLLSECSVKISFGLKILNSISSIIQLNQNNKISIYSKLQQQQNLIKTHEPNKITSIVSQINENKKQEEIKKEEESNQAIFGTLRYQYRNNIFDVFQNKFKQKKQLHPIIAIIIFKFSKAHYLYFVEKYNLTKHGQVQQNYKKFKSSVYYKQALQIKNSLQLFDAFKVTQNAIQPEDLSIQYLSLHHYGVKEQNVIFVSEVNQIFEQAHLTLTSSNIIAFDIESSGGIFKKEPFLEQIIQIATQKKVYIFDVPKLKGNKSFENLMIKLFCEVNDQIVLGFAYYGNDEKALRKILTDSNNKNSKKIQLKKVHDLQKENPVKNKISLKILVEEILKKTMSKFQQCSGWNNRPLRKCQLHYAAMDAFILLQLFKAIPEYQKSKQQAKEKAQQLQKQAQDIQKQLTDLSVKQNEESSQQTI